MLRSILILVSLAFFSSCFHRQENIVVQNTPFLNVDQTRADSILRRLTLEEKIGQLIILKTDFKDENIKESIYKWNRTGVLGGVILENIKCWNMSIF